MPMSDGFHTRLGPHLARIAEHFGTPFHIYDEAGIRKTGELVKKVFSNIPNGFQEYFAVKALPNPRILEIMKSLGFGFDCSSVPELNMVRDIGTRGENIMFTSNNTTRHEFDVAINGGGSIINFDDLSLISKFFGAYKKLPEIFCVRYNPGNRRGGNDIIGKPVEAKYGIDHDVIIDAYAAAKEAGVKRFGIHTMLASNELNEEYLVQTVQMLLNLIADIGDSLDIQFEFINIGGGIGIPYKPEDKAFDLDTLGKISTIMFEKFHEEHGYSPKLFLESGRFMTGPHGVLVTRAINQKTIYRDYIGVDACMSSLMRPGIYGAYHHITVAGKEDKNHVFTYDVAGSLCENNDKFAIQRQLPKIDTDWNDGDLLIIHDTGAHGHAMGFNYNGRLRPQELLLMADGSVRRIRRAETDDDYVKTLDVESKTLSL